MNKTRVRTRPQPRRQPSAAGFTLMELMIAAGILVFAIVGLLSTYISGSLMGVANRGLVVASTDAQYVLEKMRDTTYVNIASYTDGNFTNLQNESIRVTVTEGTNEKDVAVNVTWLEGGRQRSHVITTKIAW